MVFDIVTGNIPKVDEAVVGVRLVQKAKGFSLSSFRLEVWLKEDEEKSANNEAIKKFLEEQIITNILKDTVAATSTVKWAAHKH